MTPHDEYIFVQGIALGAALACYEMQPNIVELDQRMQRVEDELRPLLRRLRLLARIVGGLVAVGLRNGERLFVVRSA